MNAAIKHVISGLFRKKEIIKGVKIERLHRKKLDSSNNYIIEKIGEENFTDFRFLIKKNSTETRILETKFQKHRISNKDSKITVRPKVKFNLKNNSRKAS